MQVESRVPAALAMAGSGVRLDDAAAVPGSGKSQSDFKSSLLGLAVGLSDVGWLVGAAAFTAAPS